MKSLNLFKEVLQHVEQTPELIGVNKSPHKVTYPIPFFGNISSTSVITVGVNPSDGEFAPSRAHHWPTNLPPDDLHNRLKNYFNGSKSWHPWFEGWVESFEELDSRCSYSNGTAAHTDLSPRVTVPMSRAKSPVLFRQMVESDIKFVFRLISENKHLKLVMTGGKVLGEDFIAQWIRRFAPMPMHVQFIRNGTGATSFYKIHGLEREVWLFSARVSPTFRNQLVEHVRANRNELLEILQSCD